MSVAEIQGLKIYYELIGRGEKLIVLTPGGRASKDVAGLRDLAMSLSRQGFSVLIWDRPNCGESDLCFLGESESELCVDVLYQLLKSIGYRSAFLVGASGGARMSLQAAIKYPCLFEGLFLWWITGRACGLSALIHYGYGESALAAKLGGMLAVSKVSAWQEQLERNPRSRDVLIGQSEDDFYNTMQKWGESCLPVGESPMLGISLAQLTKVNVPTTIVRNGIGDPYHPKEISLQLGNALPDSKIIEPPWGEAEFCERVLNKSQGGLFVNAPLVADVVSQAFLR